MTTHMDKLKQSQLWDEFMSLIDKPQCQYVSFDLFDTIFYRDCTHHQEVFDRVAHVAFHSGLINDNDSSQFRQERINAELNAKAASKLEDVTLKEIYRQFVNYSSDKQKMLYKIELEEEHKSLNLDVVVVELLKQVLSMGKQLIFISDMYLPKEFLLQELNCLTKLNINNEQLFVSSEIGLCKITGHLFFYVQKKLKVNPEQFLHIGDNYNSDYIGALQSGWQAILYNNVKQVDVPDSVQAAIEKIIEKLKNQEIRNVYIYGAGQFMQKLVSVLKKNRIGVIAITDSKADAGEYIIGEYKIQPINSLTISENDTFVIASNAYKHKIIQLIHQYFSNRIKIICG